MRYHNLPMAEPVSEPIPDFAALLVFVGACFNIQGLETFAAPTLGKDIVMSNVFAHNPGC